MENRKTELRLISKLRDGGSRMYVNANDLEPKNIEAANKMIESAYFLDNRIGSDTKGVLFSKDPKKGGVPLDRNDYILSDETPITRPTLNNTGSGEGKPRCEFELHVIDYCGLSEHVAENQPIAMDFGTLVDLAVSVSQSAEVNNFTLNSVKKALNASKLCIKYFKEVNDSDKTGDDTLRFIESTIQIVDKAASQPNNELLEKMAEAMQIFVNRVDKGEVRSKKTYAQFKNLLSQYEQTKK